MTRALRRLPALLATAGTLGLLPAGAPPVSAATTTLNPPISGTTERLSGSDRYGTAVAISHRITVGSKYVILATGQNFPDALAGAALSFDTSTSRYAPVLLTPSDSVPKAVLDEIAFHIGPGSPVLLLGGPSALSPNIDAQLKAKGYAPQRLTSTQVPGSAPVDRFDTAAAVATQVVGASTGAVSKIILATGLNFPDALSVSASAAANSTPILLVTAAGIPKATQDFLNAHAGSSTTVLVVGGQAVAAAPTSPPGVTVKRVAGADRFDTADQVAAAPDFFGLSGTTSKRDDNLVLARGDDAGGGADALAGGPLAASAGAPLLLTNPKNLPNPTAAFTASLGYDRPLKPARAFVLGGTSAITDDTVKAFASILNGQSLSPARSATFRDTVATTSGALQPPACTPSALTQSLDLTTSGDVPGHLVLSATFCPNGGTQPPNPNSETTTVLPGDLVTFTPKDSKTDLKGFVVGGYQGAVNQNPPSDPNSGNRPTSIDFILDAAGVVGHLNFGDPAITPQGLTGGALAVVAGSTQGLSGRFTVDFPAATASGGGACIGNLGFSGTVGTASINVANSTVCNIGGTGGTVWRISGGAVSGDYTGQVVSGIRNNKSFGLQIRTATALIDTYGVLDTASPPNVSAATAPSVVQLLPDDASPVSFTVSAGTPAASAPTGCAAQTTGRTISGTDNAPASSFPGVLAIQNHFSECRTDASLGIVEPTLGGGGGTADPNKNRDVLYTPADTTAGTFRGQILYGTFTDDGNGNRVYGLTLLLEENAYHTVPPAPLPPGGTATTADDPSKSYTITRVVVTSGASNSGFLTFAR
ncbi:MAG: cell wall-binding repeat-containing protein [Acidimicrobiales bacterium]